MASPLVSRIPRCMSCMRRTAGSLEFVLQATSGQQIRGQKKLAKVSTIKVHLLQNVPGYGRRGAVIPVTSGMMRNIWYPKKVAEYMTAAKIQELGIEQNLSVERDSTFSSKAQRKLERGLKTKTIKNRSDVTTSQLYMEEATPVEPDMLDPEQAFSLLESLLPPNIDFYRTPITISQPAKLISPSIPATSTISAAAQEGISPEKPGRSSIYGSVSTNDVAANMKVVLAEDEDGARVLLASEDITFVMETDDKDRVKHLGIFEVEIRLKGAPDVVKRTIVVNAQE